MVSRFQLLLRCRTVVAPTLTSHLQRQGLFWRSDTWSRTDTLWPCSFNALQSTTRSFAKKKKKGKKKGKKEKPEAIVPPPCDPDKLPRKTFYKALPKVVADYYDVYEEYITQVWLKAYPLGANGRKLQRDLTFRLKKGTPKEKMDPAHVDALVGELYRKGKISVRIRGGSEGGGLGGVVITKPFVEGEDDTEGDKSSDSDEEKFSVAKDRVQRPLTLVQTVREKARESLRALIVPLSVNEKASAKVGDSSGENGGPEKVIRDSADSGADGERQVEEVLSDSDVTENK